MNSLQYTAGCEQVGSTIITPISVTTDYIIVIE